MVWRQTQIASASVDFASTTSGNFNNQTVTVTGAVPGDVVSLGIPNNVMALGNVNVVAWVSANDTVTLRFFNNSGSTQDPSSMTYSIQVTKP